MEFQLTYPLKSFLQPDPILKKADYALSHMEYLIENHSISYSNSLLLQQELVMHRETEASKTLGGFVPEFPEANEDGFYCNGNRLSPLNFSKKEVDDISSFFKGDIYEGHEASKQNFEKKASDYQILHLATHACEDTSTSQNTSVFFNDRALSVYELSGLTIESDLVVLSACNTGVGEYYEGEGVMSLSRGFALAGCKSSLISLWEVNDYTTLGNNDWFL